MDMDCKWMEIGHNLWKSYGLDYICGKAISLKRYNGYGTFIKHDMSNREARLYDISQEYSIDLEIWAKFEALDTKTAIVFWHKNSSCFDMDWVGCPINFLLWGGMDLDPTLRGGMELGLKICPVKTSSVHCACAHPFPINVPLAVTRWRLGRLRRNLVWTWRPISFSLCSSHGWGISARAHVHTAVLYLRNGSADCVQIWCGCLESLPKCFT